MTVALSLGLSGCGGSVHGATTPSALAATPATVDFGTVDIGNSADQQVSVVNQGTAPVQVSQLTLSSDAFTVDGQASLPINVPAGSTLNLKVHYNPTSTTDSTAQLSFVSSGSSNPVAAVKLHGKGVNGNATGFIALSSVSCGSSTLTGAGNDACIVKLTGNAGSGGFTVNLSSNNNAVSLPASVQIPAGANTANFSATVAAVNSAQNATLTASANGMSKTVNLQLNPVTAPSVAALGVSATSLPFGSVALNTAVTKSVTLTSTGSGPVKVNSATVTGSGFSVSGSTFPVTLNPSQAVVLTVQFNPTAAGAASGQLTISSNAASNSTATVSLSGTGASAAPTVSAVFCSNSSMTGSGTDACTVSLTGSAPSGGVAVGLASSNSAVSVPTSVTVPATATSAGFTATVSAVTTSQTANLTASTGSASMGFALQLNPAVPTLSINATSVSFGSVTVNTPTTQTLTLSSTGGAAVTVKSATVTGTGFTVSGGTFPLTLNPGQTASLTLQFNPTTAGAATGQLTVSSTSSTNPTAVIALSGTGVAQAYEVALSWNAPGSSSDPVTGYNIYRAPTGTTSYQLLNPSQNAPTTFVDSSVQSGQTYDYIVKSVDAASTESAPSNTTTVAIP